MQEDTTKRMSSSKNEHWCTPPEILDRVRLVNEIALDPCSNPFSLVRAKTEIAPPQDGLSVQWRQEVDKVGGGLVFLNPPYGRAVPKWLRKASKEDVELVVLVASRTDTRWFQEILLPQVDEVVFLKGRVTFMDGRTGLYGDPALFPSVVAYRGPNVTKFLKAFEGCGFGYSKV